MAQLEPLLKDADIREYKGRFHVQLEIPKSSTLTERDIDKIGALSSWDIDPNKGAEDYEGVRSFQISRENPISKKGIELAALQISGIGYRAADFNKSFIYIPDSSEFCPPNKTNFMDIVPGTLMQTDYAEKGERRVLKPSYRAYGTYTARELESKLRMTMKASKFELVNMITPQVEAYGRFLDDKLKNEEGNFGFMVFSVPSVTKQRMVTELMSQFKEFASKGAELTQSAMMFYFMSGLTFLPLVKASRELHDKARHAHLQLHLSNAYLIKGETSVLPYVMDWSTMVELGEDRETNILNRTFDLLKPAHNFISLFRQGFGKLVTKESIDSTFALIQELCMEVYSGKTDEINSLDLAYRAGKVLDKNPDDFEIVVQWMKDLGVEGFNYVPEGKKKKFAVRVEDVVDMKKADFPVNFGTRIPRNAPCPCKSGRKYKKCCGNSN